VSSLLFISSIEADRGSTNSERFFRISRTSLRKATSAKNAYLFSLLTMSVALAGFHESTTAGNEVSRASTLRNDNEHQTSNDFPMRLTSVGVDSSII